MPDPTYDSLVLTLEQQQRGHALLLARRVLEETTAAGPLSQPAHAAPMLDDLLATADYVLTGYHLEVRDEHPLHVAIHNPSSGYYQEMTRLVDPVNGDSHTVRTTQVPQQREPEQGGGEVGDPMAPPDGEG